jgi:hypothetical protein
MSGALSTKIAVHDAAFQVSNSRAKMASSLIVKRAFSLIDNSPALSDA